MQKKFTSPYIAERNDIKMLQQRILL
uniref:Uncharacterized protein n=1 Tax=Rhizophora mucronata TaxID=61149 RepID=A0A2P2QSU2_RHIMU